MVDLPGITEMVFRARSTLKVLNAETFPRSTNSVTYLQLKMMELFDMSKSVRFMDIFTFCLPAVGLDVCSTQSSLRAVLRLKCRDATVFMQTVSDQD